METTTQKTSKRYGRHKLLLKNPNVKRWHANLSRGSKITADIKLRRLGLFCEKNDMTPMEIIHFGKSDPQKLDDFLLDVVTKLEEKYAPSHIMGIIKAIKSWMSFNYIELKRRIKIKNAQAFTYL